MEHRHATRLVFTEATLTDAYVAAMRDYNAGKVKRMRRSTLPSLIRHSAFHTLDHAWEMEDRDLSGADAG